MKGTLVVADVGIRQDTEGRYCLNDLHRSAGGEKKHGPSYWLANEQTKELIAELSVTGNPVTAKEQGRVLPLIRPATPTDEPQATYATIDTRLLVIMKRDLARAMETIDFMLDVAGSPAGQRGC